MKKTAHEPLATNRCTAMSKRTRRQCRSSAIIGRSTCRMHGGTSVGAITPEGKERSRQAVLKHGMYTKASIAECEAARELIKKSKLKIGEWI